ncbi:hypothetical protein [Streptomyces spinosirectus]
MTPLEHIVGLMDPSYPEPVRRSMAQGILDKHAHDLAQKQRAVADANDELDHDHHRYAFSEAVREVADLIDPKAPRATTAGDNT